MESNFTFDLDYQYEENDGTSDMDTVYIALHLTGAVVLILGAMPLLLLILLKDSLRRNPVNMMVVSGVVGLLIHGFIALPIIIHQSRTYTISAVACTLVSFLTHIPIVPYTFVIIALYLALVKLNPGKKFLSPFVIGLIVASWLISICIGVIMVTAVYHPTVYTVGGVDQRDICAVEGNNANPAIVFTLVYIPPVLTLIILGCILLPIFCRQTHLASEPNDGFARNAAILIWVSLGFYVILTMPFEVMELVLTYSQGQQITPFYHIVFLVVHWLAAACKILLPYLWMILLPDVRSFLAKVCCKRFYKSHDPESVSLVNQK